MTDNVGFIGLGIMGSRMAANLLNAGITLSIYNRTRSKADELIRRGAVWCDSPAEAARGAGILFTMLGTPEAVESVALGAGGFIGALAPGSIWVDCSTVHPAASRKNASVAGSARIHFVDAPVLGTKKPAQEGKLAFFVGGDQADVEAVIPLLKKMGSAINHVGGNGMGAAFKMVVNLLLAQNMVMFSEAVALGQALGFSRQMLFDTLLNGPMAAPYLTVKRPKIEEGKFEADFPLKWMHKDLHLATLTAYENDVALPLANCAKEIYAKAKRAGMGELDFSAIYKMITNGPS
jgi:3-hydroxyisobutyrate dehydrogenase/glyoxylate/succinic semialdehyde reductase